MTRESTRAKRYRLMAEELRTLAGSDECEGSCEALRQVASDYDRMAATADAIDWTRDAMGERRDPD